MKYLYILIIFTVFLESCRKSNELPVTKTDIVFTELIPNIQISYDTIHDIRLYYVDLNHDNINDFRIVAAYIENHIGNQIIWGRNFLIMGLDSNKVIGSNQKTSQYKLLNNNYPIEMSSPNWAGKFEFFYDPFRINGNGEVTCQTDSAKYLGLLIKKMNQTYLGWIKLDWDLTREILRVKSFAVTKNPDTKIYTGQIN